MSLVGIYKTMDDDEWLCYQPEVVRRACLSACSSEQMVECWEGGPTDGQRTECSAAYTEIIWEARGEVPTYVPIRGGGDE